jgi:ADP-ribosyl-[dinitrogen reductase] hydrolase
MEKKAEYDRIVGAIMGAVIGDALGLGSHWYYDLEELRADCGEWIAGYIDPNPDRKDRFGPIARFRYEAGLRAGDVSQTGEVVILLLESLADQGGYDETDFTSRLDSLLGTLDGTPRSGRFTDWAMRDVWKNRHAGKDWGSSGSRADTAEAAIRSALLAARLYKDRDLLAREGHGNICLTHGDPYVASQSLAFALTIAALVGGTPLADTGRYMRRIAEKDVIWRRIPSFDVLNQAENGAVAFKSGVDIEPASRVCSLNGLSCTLGYMLPSAYYLIHRFPEGFEMAVLSAVNGGGNNMARAALTGALSGALVGLKGIPPRFISGLTDHRRLLGLAQKVARDACE